MDDDSLLFNCSIPILGRDLAETLNRTEVIGALEVAIRFDKTRRLRQSLTECLNYSQSPTVYVFSWWQKILWISLFAVMLTVATVGNSIVMWIVLAHRRMRTVTNYFLVNLSVSDLFMSLLNCTFNFTYMLDSNWLFGAFYCTVNNFVANVSVAASVFTLVAISIDRYMAIVRPLRHRMSRRNARLTLVLIWFASGLLALPCLLYSTIKTQKLNNGETFTVCFMRWPDGHYPFSTSEHVYNLIFLLVTYLLPVVAMAICYTAMGKELWGSKSIGEQTQRQLDNIKSKRKVVRMFITVIVIFTTCWLPYHGYWIYVYHNEEVARSNYVPHVYLSFYWLAMSNAMVNPIIYYWMNNQFRVYFQQIICLCCCVRPSLHRDLQSIKNMRLPRSELILRSKSYHIKKSTSVAEESVGIVQSVPLPVCKLKPSASEILTNSKQETKKKNLWTHDMINNTSL